jgi:hypothetical protein
MSQIRIFAVTECEWMAASSLEEAIAGYLKETGMSQEDIAEEDPVEVADSELDRLIFTDDEGETSVKRTFREELARRIAEGAEFPTLFATTEFGNEPLR